MCARAVPAKVHAEQGGDRVDDEELERLLHHLSGDLHDQLQQWCAKCLQRCVTQTYVLLVLVREGASEDDVVEGLVGRQTKALSDGGDALRTEGALWFMGREVWKCGVEWYLGVDVGDLAVRAALITRQLCRDAQRVT